MPPHDDATPSDLRSLLTRLARDPVVVAAVALFLGMFVPIGSPAQRTFVFTHSIDIVVIAVMIVLAGVGRRHLPIRECQFWAFWQVGLGCWLVVRVLYVAAPERWSGPAFDLATDALYVLFYLAIVLASALRAHEHGEKGPRFPWLHTSGALTLSFAFLLYFLLLPMQLRPETYASWQPSMYHYVVLDLILVLRFVHLSGSVTTFRWRTLYGFLAVTCLTWAVLDFVESLVYAGQLDWQEGGLADSLWNLPQLLLVVTVRSRIHLPRETEQSQASVRRLLGSRGGSQLVLFAIALPTAHLALNGLGVLDDELQRPRELVTLVGTLLLAGMVYAEQTQLRRHVATAARKRQRAEAALRERTTYLDALVEHSPIAIVTLDPERRVQLCNPAFERLFGYARTDVLGKRLDQLPQGLAGAEEMRDMGERLLSGEVIQVRAQRTRRDGTPVDVELFGVPLEIDGGIVGVLGLYRDRTEQVQAERERLAAAERLHRFGQAAFEGIVIAHEGVIQDANEPFARMFGAEVGALVGRSVLDLVPEVDHERFPTIVTEAMQGPREMTCRRLDDSVFAAELQVRSFRYRDRPAHVAAVRDLTERLKLESQLRQAQKMEALGALAGGVAHDFNNLLTVILGHSDLYLADATDPAGREHVEQIEGAAELAAALTRKLLVFARKQAVKPERLDLNTVAARTTETMLRRLLRENVSLQLELAPTLAAVEADRGQIEQLILNLALNAQDAMAQGGRLSIKTEDAMLLQPRSSFGLTASSGDYVCLSVGDSGSGIDPAVLPNLFDPFFTTKADGTGLGLATVYGIVEQSGGVIEVDTAVGRGTTFHVFLPVDATATASDEEVTPSPSEPLSLVGTARDQVVLVVEDVVEVGEMLVRFLEREGYTVLFASRPKAALALVEGTTGPIDLLLTDVVMPEMSGPQLAEQVLLARPDLKVLYVSGYAEDESFQQRIELGEGTFLAKPFALADLASKVRELLDGRPAA